MVEKLNAIAKECEKRPVVLPNSKLKGSTSKDQLCEHKDSDSGSEDDTSTDSQDELESFSDIDDREIDRYLFNEEEKNYKKKIWENSNREYLLEQVAKVLAAAAPKSREVVKQRQAQQAKNSGPAQSAVATSQTVKTKRLSSKVNHDCLAKLFEDEQADERNPKRVRFDLPSDNHSKFQSKAYEQEEDDELGSGDYFEDGDKDDLYNNVNMDEAYFHEEDSYNYYDDDDHY